MEQKKLLILVAVVAIVVVAAVAVALNMNGGGSAGKVTYNYEITLSGPSVYNPDHQTMDMDLVLRNDGFDIAGDGTGLQVDYITVTVTADGEEYVMSKVYGNLRIGNTETVDIYCANLPSDLTLDDIESVKISYVIPDGTEELWGTSLSTPTFVYDGNLVDEWA